MVMGVALPSALVTSATVPAPMASAGENASPAKNRRMHNVQIFFDKPLPMVKRAPIGVETRYITWRPNVSETGAAKMGPKPSAST